MTAKSGCRCWLAQFAALLLIALGITFTLDIVAPQQLQAQSSVRPPAGAVTNVIEGRVPGSALGNRSNSETWRAIRKGIRGTVSIPDKKAGQLVQSEGDSWRALKNGPIATWGALGLAGIVALLVVFYLIRGKIRVDHGMSGRTITRFADMERTAHWLLAGSFMILAITGLNVTYGKYFLLPVIGKVAFAAITAVGKWLHNYVAFAFMAGLVMILVLWIKENFPNKYDLMWLAKGGGMFAKGVHPPSKKFNAGQKILFWSIILGGLSLVVSGVALLFPFQLALFDGTFRFLNIFGLGLPIDLTMLQEMQFATLWHSIMSMVLVVIVIAHIYIGTVGMEGAFDAMSTGEVDENWAKEHHSIWAKEKAQARGKDRGRTKVAPAE